MVQRWETEDGEIFATEAEAVASEARQELIHQIERFLIERDVDRGEARGVARLVSENLGWFRTVMDDAATRILGRGQA
jgi:hypothetical protein